VEQRQPGIWWKIAPVAAVICSLYACADVDKLREAQTSFNEAATADTQSQLAAYTSGGINAGDLAVRASAGYARTIAILNSLKPDETNQLKTDKLLGSAQMLQALSYWRLQDYDSATRVAGGIDKSGLYPRDAAMSAALPGLIEISEANSDIYTGDPKDPFVTKDGKQCLFGPGTVPTGRKSLDAVDALLADAIAHLDEVKAGVSRDDPVYVYLLQATLAAYKNRSDAVANRCTQQDFDELPPHLVLPDSGAVEARRQSWWPQAQDNLNQLYCALQSKTKDQTTDPLIQFWATIQGLPLPSGASCVTK
jgi:hypothetical protein